MVFQKPEGISDTLSLDLQLHAVVYFELCTFSQSNGMRSPSLDYIQDDTLAWSPHFFTASIIIEVFLAVLLPHAIAVKLGRLAQSGMILTAGICYVAATPTGCAFFIALFFPSDALSGNAVLAIALASAVYLLYFGMIVFTAISSMSRMERQTTLALFLSGNLATAATLGYLALFPEASPIALIMTQIIISKSYLLVLTVLLWKVGQSEESACELEADDDSDECPYTPDPMEKENVEDYTVRLLRDAGFI